MFGVDDAALVMGGASLAGSALGANAAKGAAGDQAKATQAAIGEQQRQYNQSRYDTQTYRNAGNAGLNDLRRKLGLGGPTATLDAIDENDPQFKGLYDSAVNNFDQAHQARFGMSIWDPRADAASRDAQLQRYKDTVKQQVLDQRAQQPNAQQAAPEASSDFGDLTKKFSVSDFWNDPVVKLGYQSGLDLGTKALKNAAPLTTGLDSGAAMKELTKFATDYTGSKAGDSYARFTNDQGNQFNKLAAMAGIGQTAVGQTTSAGVPISGNISNLISSQGNANAAARVAGANAWSGGLNSIANYWQSQNMLNSLRGTGTGGTTGGGGMPAGGAWNVSNDWRM